ncbi:MAG: hypothetical protein ACOC9P_00805 [bacterium]
MRRRMRFDRDLYAVGEVNVSYPTDGRGRVFGSPGIQLPIYQEMKVPRLETDFTTVLSVRIQF